MGSLFLIVTKKSFSVVEEQHTKKVYVYNLYITEISKEFRIVRLLYLGMNR